MTPLFIDAHQHFWHYDPTKHVWMSEEMSILKTDFLPDGLAPHLKNCSLDGCVAVQANQAEENTFLLNLAENNDFIKGIVGWVDLQSDKVEARLEYYQKYTLMKGFRHVIHDEADIDFMLRPHFLNGISLLKKYGFTYDILIFPKHLPNTLELVAAFPDQLFVIDHIAKPSIKKGENTEGWLKGLEAVAKYENVYCKISGMVTEADWKNWNQADFTPYLDTVVELFGIDRIMYGSDWQVCHLAANYEKQFDIVRHYFSNFSLQEQEKFFGGNASKFYNL